MPFRNDRYYCLLCALHPENEHNRYVTVGGIRIHIQNTPAKNGHGIADPQPGRDYCGGYTARQIYGRREVEAAQEGDAFSRYVSDNPNYTVEDFLVDFTAKKEAQ